MYNLFPINRANNFPIMQFAAKKKKKSESKKGNSVGFRKSEFRWKPAANI